MVQSAFNKKVDPQALDAFRQNKDEIIKKVVCYSLKDPDQVSHLDDADRIIFTGMGFVIKMLDAAMSMGEISLLEDQLQWAMNRLPHEGIKMDNMQNRFYILKDVICEILPEEHAEKINSYVEWMIQRQKELVAEKIS